MANRRLARNAHRSMQSAKSGSRMLLHRNVGRACGVAMRATNIKARRLQLAPRRCTRMNSAIAARNRNVKSSAALTVYRASKRNIAAATGEKGNIVIVAARALACRKQRRHEARGARALLYGWHGVWASRAVQRRSSA